MGERNHWSIVICQFSIIILETTDLHVGGRSALTYCCDSDPHVARQTQKLVACRSRLNHTDIKSVVSEMIIDNCQVLIDQ